jgi:hypothetical protein
MHRLLMNDTILGRAHFDTVELVTCGNAAFQQIGDLAIDIAQFRGDFPSQILVDLNDLQFDLSDAASGARRICNKAACLAFKS